MKKFHCLTSILLILLLGFVAFSCKEKDETPIDYTPVLHTNFDYTVDQNVVKFTTTLTGNVWWTYNGTDYAAVDQKAEVAFALAGTYSFTCSILTGGQTLTSTPFDVEVLVGDTTVYDTDYWKYLTGGYNHKKEWVLDVEAKVHSGPLSFLGTSWNFVNFECADQNDCWLWDADLGFTFENDSAAVRMDWPGTEGYGVMSFDLIGGNHFIADKKKEPAESGTYALDWDNRTITITGGTILRSYKPFAIVNEIQVDGITGISDWQNYKIYDLSDTVLRLAVSRDQDVAGEGVCWLIYNFVEKNIYESIVIEPITYYEPVLTTFTGNDLVGTWHIAQVAQDWIGWPETGLSGGKRLNGWNNRADMITTLAGWGASTADSIFTAGDAKEYIFNGDGTCTLNGIANTYSVTDGVITFGTALVDEFALVWISPTGTSVPVIDVQFDIDGNPYTSEGIWIGQKNGDKNESSSVQLVKQ
jgi:hypothetical protein